MNLNYLDYPRPQFVRKNWIDLNGDWEFMFDDENIGLTNKWFMQKEFILNINVPYAYQSELSGIGKNEQHDVVWYKKKVILEKISAKRIFLNFEACDYKTDLWINGVHIGEHCGGHVPFSFEITNAVRKDENIIVVRVEDFNTCSQPIGKQSWKKDNFLCWYTRTTGIWQPVWIEILEKNFIKNCKMTPNIDNGKIHLDISVDNSHENVYLEGIISFKDKFITKFGTSFKNGRAKLSVDVTSDDPDFRMFYWRPETPNLYDIEFKLFKNEKLMDEVKSYFGMRKISKSGRKIFLNNQEFYQKLILDQGYFGKGLMTPTPEQLEDDVNKIKEMGFNGVRKHQKIEDNRFMYLCDVLGLVVWAEMPSPFEFSDETNKNVVKELYGLIKKHYNNPSVIAYTVLNESWGINEVYDNPMQQNFVNSLYYLVKSLDNSRIVIGNDGWQHTISDILTIHDYTSDEKSLSMRYENFEETVDGSPSLTSLRTNYAKGYKYSGEPIMISEYGGVAYSLNSEVSSWGYGKRITDPEKILDKIENLTKAIMDIDYMCGFCYTQLSDVEQEANGLLDHEHNYKFDPKRIKEILSYKHNGGFIFE
ncbi:sugar-binding domain-containing protein [uncultured Ilyobacter sp.]|uniref:glycoside hydrolase family 2 protein n=1 Tax=uncultured Ilyobacter sp. TaxID=544433 RepID=UPI0029C664D4|nr:sugar-binding domain-containing protein [uncultured Ilyobacter sp.]